MIANIVLRASKDYSKELCEEHVAELKDSIVLHDGSWPWVNAPCNKKLILSDELHDLIVELLSKNDGKHAYDPLKILINKIIESEHIEIDDENRDDFSYIIVIEENKDGCSYLKTLHNARIIPPDVSTNIKAIVVQHKNDIYADVNKVGKIISVINGESRIICPYILPPASSYIPEINKKQIAYSDNFILGLFSHITETTVRFEELYVCMSTLFNHLPPFSKSHYMKGKLGDIEFIATDHVLTLNGVSYKFSCDPGCYPAPLVILTCGLYLMAAAEVAQLDHDDYYLHEAPNISRPMNEYLSICHEIRRYYPQNMHIVHAFREFSSLKSSQIRKLFNEDRDIYRVNLTQC
ncbi:MAG: hypothetical protein NZM04_09295 [Methylacidiphilales bacterium]|nr:hypothetical protein [Candidatus Methylacidiphilales bacterium]